MSAEFPRAELEKIGDFLAAMSLPEDAVTIVEAIEAYDELALRVCEDNTKASIQIGALRARIAELEGQPAAADPLQLTIDQP